MIGKRCTKCGSLQPLYRFHKDANRRDGLHYYCEDCAADGKGVKQRCIREDRPQPYWGAGR